MSDGFDTARAREQARLAQHTAQGRTQIVFYTLPEACDEIERLRALLSDWRDLPGEPVAGDGLCATEDVIAEQSEWSERYADLVARTETALFDRTRLSQIAAEVFEP